MSVTTRPQTQLPVLTELADLVANILGDAHYKSITRKMALAIYSTTENRHTCFIQFYSHEGEEFEYPVLWYYGQWVESLDRWKVQKAYSQKLQDEAWILTANIELVKKELLRRWLLGDTWANILATKWIRHLDECQWKVDGLGVKLKTKVEEI